MQEWVFGMGGFAAPGREQGRSEGDVTGDAEHWGGDVGS
jgi:hypothetical protein